MKTTHEEAKPSRLRAGHFRYFLIFPIIKNNFLHFYQVILTGSGLLKIGLVQKLVFNFIKSAKKSFFIIEQIKKYRKCPALHLVTFTRTFTLHLC